MRQTSVRRGREPAAAPLGLRANARRGGVDVWDAGRGGTDRGDGSRRWRWPCCCWAAREATAGKYSVAQCGWRVGSDAELGRHDRWRQVPPRCLVRAAGRRRPLRRRPREELHPRRLDRLRHPVRPLALGGADRGRASPGSAAPGGTRCTTAWSSASASATGTAASMSSPALPAPTSAHASSSPASPARSRRSRTGCSALVPRANGAASSPGSWSAIRALTITVQDDGGPGAGVGGDIVAGGWRSGDPGRLVLRWRRRWRRALR